MDSQTDDKTKIGAPTPSGPSVSSIVNPGQTAQEKHDQPSTPTIPSVPPAPKPATPPDYPQTPKPVPPQQAPKPFGLQGGQSPQPPVKTAENKEKSEQEIPKSQKVPGVIPPKPAPLYVRPVQNSTDPQKPPQSEQKDPSPKSPFPEVNSQQGHAKEQKEIKIGGKEKVFKSSIRTMANDLARIREGKKPAGVEVQKVISPDKKPGAKDEKNKQVSQHSDSKRSAVEETRMKELERILSRAEKKPPTPPAPMVPTAQIKQKEAVSTKPSLRSQEQTERSMATPSLESKKTEKEPSKIVAKDKILGVPVFTPPPSKRRTRTLFLLLITLVLIVGGGTYYWLVVIPHQDTEQSNLPTPEYTGKVWKLDTVFTTEQNLTLSESDTPINDFNERLNEVIPVGGELSRLIVSMQFEPETTFAMLSFFDKMNISYPESLKTSLVNDDSAILVYGQKDIFDESGNIEDNAQLQPRIVFIMQIKNIVDVNNALEDWEPKLAIDLQLIFDFIAENAASSGFLGNKHEGYGMRYKNFPFPDKTIDYATISATNRTKYLIIANSREAIFATLEKLLRAE